MVTFKKHHPASRAYGRGRDSFYIPAVYQVMKDGRLVGYISGSNPGYMERITWQVYDANHRPIKWFYKGGLKRAKAWAAPYFDNGALDDSPPRA